MYKVITLLFSWVFTRVSSLNHAVLRSFDFIVSLWSLNRDK